MSARQLLVADVVAAAAAAGKPLGDKRVRKLAARGVLRGRRVVLRGQPMWVFSQTAVDKFLALERPAGRPKAAGNGHG